jgi:hypothetical protein
MPAFPRPRFWRALRHRVCVAGSFFAYLIATLGLPLPAAVHKDVSQPFPCQNHPCGCQTAEQCWRSCCCFTPEERWAWARENNVEPPSYAEKPAASGWNTVKLRDRDTDASTATCRKECGEPKCSNCCQSQPADPVKTDESDSKKIRWVLGFSTWSCQGFTTLWLSAGAVVPVPLPFAWVPESPPSDRLPFVRVDAPFLFSTPPSPPPRFVS